MMAGAVLFSKVEINRPIHLTGCGSHRGSPITRSREIGYQNHKSETLYRE